MPKDVASAEEERARIAAELQAVRDAAREEPRRREVDEVLPVARETAPVATAVPLPAADAPKTPPPHPDNTAVNQLWALPLSRAPRGLAGRAFGLLRRLLAPLHEAQTAFNARQVQLDNEILEYVDARFDQTHRHYDRVLGDYGRHIADIDQRHLILQGELVAHVHDLVKRIDLVLAQGEGSRVSLEASLRDVRARLARLEERLSAR
jgi:hypothetical protein